jgi:hypothetical protein
MPDREAIAIWRTRLRWRLRGAWQWPTFWVVTLADGVILSRLPFAGDGASLFEGVLLACFFNLVVVAVVAPAGGWLRRRRRPGLPRGVATDQVGAAALVALAAIFVAAGLAHRSTVQGHEAEYRAQLVAAKAWIAHQAPRQYQAGLTLADTWQQGPHLYRTCFPGPDPRRHLCLVVRTDEPTPIVRRDADQRPNATVAGPDNPGRSAR